MASVAYISLFLSSCNDDTKSKNLEIRLSYIENQLSNLQTDVSHLQIDSEFNKYTFVTPGSQGYGTINLEVGTILVSLRNIEAYANGSKVTLQFGNPLTAQITRLNFHVDYGPVGGSGVLIDEKKKSKEISLPKTLMPASWTECSIVLDGVPPNSLGIIKISNPAHEGIQLHQPKQ